MPDWLHPRSLAGRLRLASCVVLPLIIGLTALILDQAFKRSLDAAVQERLRLSTYVLMGAAEAGGGQLWMPATLQEPRFNQPGSGLIGAIHNRNGTLLWRSTSALGESPESPPLPPRAGENIFAHDRPDRFIYSYRVLWETEDGNRSEFLFSTQEVNDSYRAELSAFRLHLWGGLGLLAALLLLAQGMVLRWGLRPLTQLATDLQQIESGQRDDLPGHYPHEITPVTRNLNLLLQAERRQRERYRNTLADLAHSLKTPLAVLRNLPGGSEAEAIDEQIARMDQIISHQLGRSVTTPAHPLQQAVAILPAVRRIGQALQKVYRDKTVRFEVSGNEPGFRGDERDLMEILGNLIDNAFKYGGNHIRVSTGVLPDRIEIIVDDNGPGIAPDLHGAILQRGTRADSLSPGQGIGLSVVRDILSGYQGSLNIASQQANSLGGARFIVSLPRAGADKK